MHDNELVIRNGYLSCVLKQDTSHPDLRKCQLNDDHVVLACERSE